VKECLKHEYGKQGAGAFSLVELMITMVILLAVVGVVMSAMMQIDDDPGHDQQSNR